MKEQYRRWNNLKNGRSYIAYIHLDMLNDWAITCAWGGKDRRPSRIKHIDCDSFEQAMLMLNDIEKKRLDHGYEPVLMEKASLKNGN